MSDLEQQAADLLADLIVSHEIMIEEHIDAEFLPEAHATLKYAQLLLDALRNGRVRLEKTDKWVE